MLAGLGLVLVRCASGAQGLVLVHASGAQGLVLVHASGAQGFRIACIL